MNALNELILWLDQFLGSAMYFPWLLLGTGFFFTIYLKFPQIRYFKHAIRVVMGKYDKDTDKDNEREVIYMRYDDINMYYIYLCTKCDTVWKT